MLFFQQSMITDFKVNLKQRKKMKIRIWLFDDEKMILDSVGEFLREFGYEVFCFESPADIAGNLKIADSDVHADVVITDIQMPGMDGIEFVRRLVECGFNRENIAMVSGYWTEDYREFAGKTGVRCFDKPFGFKDVLDWVEERQCGMENNCLIAESLQQGIYSPA